MLSDPLAPPCEDRGLSKTGPACERSECTHADRDYRRAQQELNDVLQKYPVKQSAVLEALHIVQREKNYLTNEGIQAVAEALDMTATEVNAIVGFYTQLRRQPTGRYLIQVCTDLPCALRGADAFFRRLCQRLALPPEGGTTADDLITVEEVVCLAACDRAPVAQINLQYYENLTDETMDAVIARLREQPPSACAGTHADRCDNRGLPQ